MTPLSISKPEQIKEVTASALSTPPSTPANSSIAIGGGGSAFKKMGKLALGGSSLISHAALDVARCTLCTAVVPPAPKIVTFTAAEKTVKLAAFETSKQLYLAACAAHDIALSAFHTHVNRQSNLALSLAAEEMNMQKQLCYDYFMQAYDAGCFPDLFDPEQVVRFNVCETCIETTSTRLDDLD